MNRNSNLPLTETTFYILLAIRTPMHGYAIMQRIEELSEGQVRLAAGTMYGAIENLLKKGLIVSVKSDDMRRKLYTLTPLGESVLMADCQRMKRMIIISEKEIKQ